MATPASQVGFSMPPAAFLRLASRQRIPHSDAMQSITTPAAPAVATSVAQHSVLSQLQKYLILFVAILMALLDALFDGIYFPILNALGDGFHTSLVHINLTLAICLFVEGLAPRISCGLSEIYGRRPVFLACFLIHMCASLGLAMQSSFAGLLVLRTVQSAGSSGMLGLGLASLRDVFTSVEWKRKSGYITAASSIGYPLGPVLSGALQARWGWRSLFWFLTALSGTSFITILFLLPETCRNVVGNGSVVPARTFIWNTSVLEFLRRRHSQAGSNQQTSMPNSPPGTFGVRRALRILFDKECGILICYASFILAGYYMVLSGLPGILYESYGYTAPQIGYCYVAAEMGSNIGCVVMGLILDFNFRRYVRANGIPLLPNQRPNFQAIPIEKLRLQIVLCTAAISMAMVVGLGWALRSQVFIAGPIVLLFCFNFFSYATYGGLVDLINDINPRSGDFAIAARNFACYTMSAGGTAVVVPMINAIGFGWVCTIIAGVWFAGFPFMCYVIRKGPEWRAEKVVRDNRRAFAKYLRQLVARTPI